MTDASGPRVSVVITTRNRRDLVVQAIESCLRQTEPCEILVYDDASTDGTAEQIGRSCPAVRLIRAEGRVGYIALRNRGFREARGEFVVSLDDDAYFSSNDTLSQVVALFEQHPRAAVVALAFIEPRSAGEKMRVLPRGARLRNYVGCAHAIRRELALEMGGYPPLLVHQGEERDLAIRFLDRGFEIRFADSPPVVHLASPLRDRQRMNYYGFRNTILFSWMRLPAPEFLVRCCLDTIRLLGYRFTLAALPLRLRALFDGWAGICRYRAARAPVSRAAYRKYRSLPSHGPLPGDGPKAAPPGTGISRSSKSGSPMEAGCRFPGPDGTA